MIRFITKAIRYFWVIILCMVLSTGAAAAYTLFLADNVYEGRVSYYIYQNLDNDIYRSLQAGDMLASDVSNLIRSSYIIDSVKTKVPSYQNVSSDDIAASIDTVILNNTRILDITMQGSNPKDIKAFLVELTNTIDQFSSNLYGQKTLLLLGNVKVSNTPVSPVPFRDIPLGAVGGFIIGLFIIFLIDSFQEETNREESKKRIR